MQSATFHLIQSYTTNTFLHLLVVLSVELITFINPLGDDDVKLGYSSNEKKLLLPATE